MEVMEQITIDEWMRWKEDIREKLRETAENFVYIGYRLRQIRDSGMYGGAADVFEFALKEYGLGKSTVSRFIAINEKFSEGGNSPELKAEYRAIGSSKLAEMLTLTDAECSMITEKTTVAQIRELKNFSRKGSEEAEKTPEIPNGGGFGLTLRQEDMERTWKPLQKCIIWYFWGKKEMLNAAMGHISRGEIKQAAETINPSGNATSRRGLVFLFMNEYKDGVKYKTFGSDEVTVLPWDEFAGEIWDIFEGAYIAGDAYGVFYGKAEKEAEKGQETEAVKAGKTPEIPNAEGLVATSQQEEKEGEDYVEEMADEEAEESSIEECDDAPGDADETEQGDDADGAGKEVGEVHPEADGSREGPDVTDMGDYLPDSYAETFAEIGRLLKDMQECYREKNWKQMIMAADRLVPEAENMMTWEGEA